ncbi:MAG: hypothetical protein methR_P1857 [Methyloprofundus sp.]|nr:MAG: hypothetical protein methR_P1857 [Methyloprofundus sp.]
MLINTLTSLFAYTSLINPLEASIILLITANIIYILTPNRKPDAEPSISITKPQFNIYMYLQEAWLGKESLLRACMPFFIIFNSSLFYADYRAINGSYTIESWLTILIILALPTLWWTISVWRCSVHASRLWATTARFVTIVAAYEYCLRIAIAKYYPEIFFNCQQLIMEFGDCF